MRYRPGHHADRHGRETAVFVSDGLHGIEDALHVGGPGYRGAFPAPKLR
ncbi:hypothetical protein [Streptomyces acidiscabies]